MLPCLNPNCGQPNQDGVNFCQRCGVRFLLKDRYHLVRSLGQGGFGRTYLVTDEGRGGARSVIKQFLPDIEIQNKPAVFAEALRLFEREADRLLQLDQHPQVPTLFEYFEENDCRYLVQQYIEGQNLHEELEQQGCAFNEAQIHEVLLDLLPVLKFIHGHELIHRDLKPANILRRQSDRRLVLVDFGAAKVATQTALSRTTARLYSVGYGAPEQEAGRGINFATDLYGLGTTCLYLLTQQNPLDLFDYAQFQWVWRDSVLQPISDSLAEVLDKLIAKGIANRYQSADEVLEALNGHQSQAGDPPGGLGNAGKGTQGARSPITQIQIPIVSPKPLKESAMGVSYDRLERLLSEKNWIKADQETGRVMLEATGQLNRGYLAEADFTQFPYPDLRTIDQLWLHYSRGRFGFSVQQQIYQTLGGSYTFNQDIWEVFCDAVGWRKNHQWLLYPDLNFTANAPAGHLPLGGWVVVKMVVVMTLGIARTHDLGFGLGALFSRLETCRF